MPDPAPEPPERRCPACGYSMRGLQPVMQCPECGSNLTPWTFRWRTWFALSGLDLLCWGVPLLFASFLVTVAIEARKD